VIKVLIVDDIPETRDHLSRLLGLERDLDVAGTAGTGEEAIKVAMELRPDVIVMDINMPGMDGVAAAEIISQRLPSCPIIMMSVHGEADQLKRAISAGRPRVPRQAVQRRRVLGQHPHRLRAGARPAHPVRVLPPSVRRGRSAPTDAGEHQVVAVFSPKGGAGRTTIATNLAVALHQETGRGSAWWTPTSSSETSASSST
jgi:pilus assembly protein CpaE